MAGPLLMPAPEHPLVQLVGVVPDGVRDALLAGADVLVAPSPYESLSMALLEGWNQGRPALVNGRCAVLKGQVERAGGGLYYESVGEFVAALDYLLAHADVSRRLGEQGFRYVEREYRWPVITRKIEEMLAC
jgi:glycosyltransferase involved in cell wall biosynthesis